MTKFIKYTLIASLDILRMMIVLILAISLVITFKSIEWSKRLSKR